MSRRRSRSGMYADLASRIESKKLQKIAITRLIRSKTVKQALKALKKDPTNVAAAAKVRRAFLALRMLEMADYASILNTVMPFSEILDRWEPKRQEITGEEGKPFIPPEARLDFSGLTDEQLRNEIDRLVERLARLEAGGGEALAP